MKVLEKTKAVDLRKQGKTYSEIIRQLGVSKGSLNVWLRDVKLSDSQTARIKYKNDQIRAKFIKYNRDKREAALIRKEKAINSTLGEIKCLSLKELKLIGIALYWAEGTKSDDWGTIDFANSDPSMIKLMIQWLRKVCGVAERKFRLKIQMYDSSRVKEATEYWSKITSISISQFTKPYLKVSRQSKRRRGNTLPYGTLHIRVSDRELVYKIRGWIMGVKGAIV